MLLDPAIIELRYDSLCLSWADDQEYFEGFFAGLFRENRNRFLGTSDPDLLFVWLIAGDRAWLGIDLLEGEPVVGQRWEDVVEASITVPAGARPHWTTLSDLTGPFQLPAGDYRVRLSASGRDGAVPTLLLEFWPAPPRPDAVVRLRSERGRAFHDDWRVGEVGEAARVLRSWSRSGTTLVETVASTSYGQMELRWSPDGCLMDDLESLFAGQANGLVGAAHPGGVYFHLARYGCGSLLRMEHHASAPLLEAAAQDVVEVSTTLPDHGEPRWEAWGGMGYGELALAPGSYRLRVSAQGRDEGEQGEFTGYLVDSYLLQFWPAEPQPDAILRTTSDNARRWHEVWGGR